MMESMFAVMQRINEIRQRFHPMRHNTGEDRRGFDAALSQRIREQAAAPPRSSFGGGAPEDVDGMTVNAIQDMARAQASRNRISPALVNAIIETESSYDPRAVSPRGAMGLMQLMPETARSLGVQNPFEPEENIRGGVQHLRRLLDKYGGDYRRALAAYNAGETAVDRSGGIPDYPETREYVSRVIGAYLRNRE